MRRKILKQMREAIQSLCMSVCVFVCLVSASVSLSVFFFFVCLSVSFPLFRRGSYSVSFFCLFMRLSLSPSPLSCFCICLPVCVFCLSVSFPLFRRGRLFSLSQSLCFFSSLSLFLCSPLCPPPRPPPTRTLTHPHYTDLHE